MIAHTKCLLLCRLLVTGADTGPAPDDCHEDPARAECRNYQYPESRALDDLQMLCDAMPDMPGCSVWEACKVRNPSAGAGAHGHLCACSLLMEQANRCSCDNI